MKISAGFLVFCASTLCCCYNYPRLDSSHFTGNDTLVRIHKARGYINSTTGLPNDTVYFDIHKSFSDNYEYYVSNHFVPAEIKPAMLRDL